MPENHSGQCLDLDVGHRGALRLGEAADLGLGEADVLHVARGDLRHRGLGLGGRQAEALGRIAVELLRKLANRGVTPRLDFSERRLDRGTDAGVVVVPLGFGFAALEVFGHGCSLFSGGAAQAGAFPAPGVAPVSISKRPQIRDGGGPSR